MSRVSWQVCKRHTGTPSLAWSLKDVEVATDSSDFTLPTAGLQSGLEKEPGKIIPSGCLAGDNQPCPL